MDESIERAVLTALYGELEFTISARNSKTNVKEEDLQNYMLWTHVYLPMEEEGNLFPILESGKVAVMYSRVAICGYRGRDGRDGREWRERPRGGHSGLRLPALRFSLHVRILPCV